MNLIFKKVTLVVLSLLSQFSARAEIPTLLKEVEKKYSQYSSLSAKFTQVVESKAMGTKKTSTGKILAQRPDKIRWETEKPFPNLLISDGKKFWQYTPPVDSDDRGHLVTGNSSRINTKLANALLSGKFSTTPGIQVRRKTDQDFIVVPKKGTAGTVQEAIVSIDPKNHLVSKIVLKNRGGNESEIQLSEIELGKPLPDQSFSFTPPEKTDLEELK